VSEAEFAGCQETVHLLRGLKNAARLMESVRQTKAGQPHEKVLVASRKRAR
jgi:PHD/YefM family antitoxin component YafN of YafNO toxin-antitoxin module